MSDSLLEFPCEFPLKIMGRREAGFRETVIALLEQHAGPVGDDRVTLRESRDGNFVALTVVVRAESQAQLDAMYVALTAHEQVLMVL
jgi:uncharacterized protein